MSKLMTAFRNFYAPKKRRELVERRFLRTVFLTISISEVFVRLGSCASSLAQCFGATKRSRNVGEESFSDAAHCPLRTKTSNTPLRKTGKLSLA